MDCTGSQHLMEKVLAADPSLAAEDVDAFHVHLMLCQTCNGEYQAGCDLISLYRGWGELSSETVSLLTSDAGLVTLESAERMYNGNRMSAEEAREDLKRRCPDLALALPREERAFCRLRHRGWMAGVTAVAASLAMAALLAWHSWLAPAPIVTAPAVVANISKASGSFFAEVVTESGRQPIGLTEQIIAVDEPREILLSGMHRVVMNRQTVASVHPIAESPTDKLGYDIQLERGELYVEVVPGHLFHVLTPTARLKITGTRFNVMSDGECTELILTEGSIQFASLSGQAPVDVLAGHASSVIGSAAPTAPTRVDALAKTQWARQISLRHAATAVSSGAFVEMDIDSMWGQTKEVDFDKVDYERWREENREWFTKQFPWAVRLEKVLNSEEGMTVDYLDILMISGDIWQFHYPQPRQTGSHIAAFHPAGIEHLARWYGLDGEYLLKVVDQHSLATNRPEGENTGEAFANAIQRWRTDLKATTERDAAGNLALFSLQASTYLSNTRAGAYVWIQKYPMKVERLLTRQYTTLFTADLISPSRPESSISLLNHLKKQLEACRQNCQLAQQWLTTPYNMDCPTGSVPSQQLQERLLLLIPNK